MTALAVARPQLRIHYYDEPSGEEIPEENDLLAAQLLAREPRLAWRVRDFYDNWSLPKVFRTATKQRASGTLDGYENTLRYWEQITADPRLVDLLLDPEDEQTIDFVGLLPEWGYSRRGMRRGEPIRVGPLAENPAFEPLKSTTAAGHATRIATLLHQAGPQYEMRERVAKLLDRRIYVPPVEADFEPKPPFQIEVARQIAAACGRMKRPYIPHWLPLELWWQTRLALFYYTGLRAGTVVSLARSHFEMRKGTPWLKVPKTIVRKTRKAIELAVHPQLAGLLRSVEALRPPGARPDDLLLPPGCGYRNFLDLHSELQQQAGLDETQRQSPHAWRRTHLTQLAEMGLGRQLEFARVAADHASVVTTETSYVSTLVNQARLALPNLY